MGTPITGQNEKFMTQPNHFGGTPLKSETKTSNFPKKNARNNSVSGGAVVGNHGLSFNMGDINNVASNGFMQSQ